MTGRAGDEHAMEFRINDLARESGIPVRNIRLYQERRILPPPTRRGRVGWYTEAHLARLRLIARLLDRGYSLAHIGELISAWERGRDLDDVLGLESAARTAEPRTMITAPDLQRLFGNQDTRGLLERAVALGMLRPEGTRFRILSPQLLDSAAQLVQLGFPLPQVLGVVGATMQDLDRIAERYVALIADESGPEGGAAVAGGPEGGRGADLVRRVTPLARRSVDAMLAIGLRNQVEKMLGSGAADAHG
jgi:DNA-binding transcriptional MerR regulator